MFLVLPLHGKLGQRVSKYLLTIGVGFAGDVRAVHFAKRASAREAGVRSGVGRCSDACATAAYHVRAQLTQTTAISSCQIISCLAAN